MQEREVQPHKRDRDSPTSPTAQPVSKRNTMEASHKELMKAISGMKDDIKKDMLEMKAFFNEKVEKLSDQLEAKFLKWESEKAELIRNQNELENRIEQLERKQKRSNIIITGLQTNNRPIKSCVEQLFQEQIDRNITLADAHLIRMKSGSTKIIATMSCMEFKNTVMKNKMKLSKEGPTKIFVTDDLTKKEEEIQFKAREFARAMKTKNKEATVAYRRVYVNNVPHVWDELTQEFVSRKN